MEMIPYSYFLIFSIYKKKNCSTWLSFNGKIEEISSELYWLLIARNSNQKEASVDQIEVIKARLYQS